MTNETIIQLHRRALLKEGIIGSVGTKSFCDGHGNRVTFPEPEEIYTAHAWIKRGFQVRPGETPVATFPIWRYQDDRSTYPVSRSYYRAAAQFYKADQVEPITH